MGSGIEADRADTRAITERALARLPAAQAAHLLPAGRAEQEHDRASLLRQRAARDGALAALGGAQAPHAGGRRAARAADEAPLLDPGRARAREDAAAERISQLRSAMRRLDRDPAGPPPPAALLRVAESDRARGAAATAPPRAGGPPAAEDRARALAALPQERAEAGRLGLPGGDPGPAGRAAKARDGRDTRDARGR